MREPAAMRLVAQEKNRCAKSCSINEKSAGMSRKLTMVANPASARTNELNCSGEGTR